MTKSDAFGAAMGEAIIRAAHLTYNAPRGRNMVRAVIHYLTVHLNDMQPKKATKEYYDARYAANALSKEPNN